MEQNGYNVTAERCSRKWRYLVGEYKKVVDNNNRSGSDRKECHFYKAWISYTFHCNISKTCRNCNMLDICLVLSQSNKSSTAQK